MAIPSSRTINYDSVLASTLDNLEKSGAVTDNISTSNALFFKIIKSGNYKGGASGNKMRVHLLYEIQNGDTYSGYDLLDTTPVDGHTAAFFDWGQWAVPCAISGKEERENEGSETQAFDLVEAKVKQTLLGAQEGFARAFIQGNGPHTATAITTPYTSTNNGSTFIDPLPKLVAYDPTASVSVGNINQNTFSWWRNKTKAATDTNFASFFKDLDNLYNTCSLGAGGGPDLHFTDQLTHEFYVAAMRNQNRYTDYKKADIPFDAVAFKSHAVVWDQFVPDALNGTIASIPVSTSGTWYMLNTKFWQMKYFLNFKSQGFVKPENQDAKVSQLLWHGGVGVSNRRKHGVLGGINTTLTS